MAEKYVEQTSGAEATLGKQLFDGITSAAAMARRPIGNYRSLLIIDSDVKFARRLSQAMAESGFKPMAAESIASVKSLTNIDAPAYAITELRLQDGNGFEVLEHLRSLNPNCKVIVLTSYGSLATAVAAVKLGALDYLSKPVDLDVLLSTLCPRRDAEPPLLDTLMTSERVRWEHITRTLEYCGHNVSETARQLKMHRRTLQRLLSNGAPMRVQRNDSEGPSRGTRIGRPARSLPGCSSPKTEATNGELNLRSRF